MLLRKISQNLQETTCSESVFRLLNCNIIKNTAQNLEFSITDFFSKCDQIRRFLRIWSHLLKKSVMENFILRAVKTEFDTGISTEFSKIFL